MVSVQNLQEKNFSSFSFSLFYIFSWLLREAYLKSGRTFSVQWRFFAEILNFLRSFKNGVMRNFTEFRRKHMCWNLFFLIKFKLQICSFIENAGQRRCFLVNFAKFVRTLFLQNTTRRLLLIIAVSTVNYFLQKKLHRRCLTGLKIDFRLRV